jgi:toxin YoeB
MNFHVIISERALQEINQIKKSGDKISYRKIFNFLEELEVNPREGTGQTEKLKHQESDIWSRRINKKDRLIYEINEDVVTVIVLSALGHYKDK